MSRPNVLLIVTDQQRPDTMGFRGQTPCRTPNMDRIAREGVSFDRAMTPAPLCLPSRAAMLTGLYPTENQMMSNETGRLAACGLLDHFRAAGYRVDYAGKWHLGEGNIDAFTDRNAGDSTKVYSQWCREQGLIDGWMFNDARTRTTRTPSMSTPKTFVQDLPLDKTNEAYITDIAIDMIRTRDRDRPFFQVCSWNGPHPPFVIPEPFYSMYDPADVARPPNFGPQPDEPATDTNSFYRQLFLDHGADFDAWRKSYAVYWGFVSMVDAELGRLLAAVEAEGLLDETIVVFASDHGENLGAHGLWHKMVAYEESLRVPFLVRAPGVGRRGLRSQAPASLIDLAPTLADLCGLGIAAEWQGASLAGEITGDRAPSSDRPLFSVQQPLGPWMGTKDWRMVEQNRLKYVWNRGDRDQLFDLDRDPFEVCNLIEDEAHHGDVAKLRAALSAFLRRTDDPLLPCWPYS